MKIIKLIIIISMSFITPEHNILTKPREKN